MRISREEIKKVENLEARILGKVKKFEDITLPHLNAVAEVLEALHLKTDFVYKKIREIVQSQKEVEERECWHCGLLLTEGESTCDGCGAILPPTDEEVSRTVDVLSKTKTPVFKRELQWQDSPVVLSPELVKSCDKLIENIMTFHGEPLSNEEAESVLDVIEDKMKRVLKGYDGM